VGRGPGRPKLSWQVADVDHMQFDPSQPPSPPALTAPTLPPSHQVATQQPTRPATSPNLEPSPKPRRKGRRVGRWLLIAVVALLAASVVVAVLAPPRRKEPNQLLRPSRHQRQRCQPRPLPQAKLRRVHNRRAAKPVSRQSGSIPLERPVKKPSSSELNSPSQQDLQRRRRRRLPSWRSR
jgi:hypothetical protein